MTRATCPKCGAVYNVTRHKFWSRDEYRVRCQCCGLVLTEGNASTWPVYELIKPGKDPDAQGT